MLMDIVYNNIRFELLNDKPSRDEELGAKRALNIINNLRRIVNKKEKIIDIREKKYKDLHKVLLELENELQLKKSQQRRSLTLTKDVLSNIPLREQKKMHFNVDVELEERFNNFCHRNSGINKNQFIQIAFKEFIKKYS